MCNANGINFNFMLVPRRALKIKIRRARRLRSDQATLSVLLIIINISYQGARGDTLSLVS